MERSDANMHLLLLKEVCMTKQFDCQFDKLVPVCETPSDFEGVVAYLHNFLRQCPTTG